MGGEGGTHTDNTVLSISKEYAGVLVLHDDPNLTAGIKQTPTHIPCVVFIKPLFALEDNDGEGLDCRRHIELLVDPVEGMRNR